MDKLYRLVGAAGMSFQAFGVTVGVRANDQRTLEMLNGHLPPSSRHQECRTVKRLYSFYVNPWGRQPEIRRFHALYRDHQMLCRSEAQTDLYEEFERDVDSYIAAASTTGFFVHAGVVGWNGTAIVIPGRSYSGKTTLIAEFLRAGAIYYSDELAFFDQHGYVHSFDRPLRVRVDAGNKQKRKLAGEFGARTGGKPLPVGLVILTEYRKSASWRPRETSPGRGVLRLLANSFSARANPASALRILTQATDKACFLRGARGEANEVVRSVQERFGTSFLVAPRE